MKIENRVKELENFYGECAKIFDTEHQYRDGVPRSKVNRDCEIYTPCTRATRWGGRSPGNGRFPGFGLIRVFGTVVHISIHTPKKISATITGLEEALLYLREEMNNG